MKFDLILFAVLVALVVAIPIWVLGDPDYIILGALGLTVGWIERLWRRRRRSRGAGEAAAER